MRALTLSFMLLAMPLAAAETQMSPEAFEAYVTGKTLYYGAPGQEPYGAEEYLDDRRVRWSFLDGECKEGRWYVDLDLICFVYEDMGEPQCWSFFMTGRGLRALFENDPGNQTLYEVAESSGPLQCFGPEVGV